jgi:hypothetical protein
MGRENLRPESFHDTKSLHDYQIVKQGTEITEVKWIHGRRHITKHQRGLKRAKRDSRFNSTFLVRAVSTFPNAEGGMRNVEC